MLLLAAGPGSVRALGPTVFSVVNGDPASANAAYDILKARVDPSRWAAARARADPALMPIIGETKIVASPEQLESSSWSCSTPQCVTLVRRGSPTTSGPASASTARSTTFLRRPTAASFLNTLLAISRREN